MWFNDYFSLWTIFFGRLLNQNIKVTKIQNISGHDDLWHFYLLPIYKSENNTTSK